MKRDEKGRVYNMTAQIKANWEKMRKVKLGKKDQARKRSKREIYTAIVIEGNRIKRRYLKSYERVICTLIYKLIRLSNNRWTCIIS